MAVTMADQTWYPCPPWRSANVVRDVDDSVEDEDGPEEQLETTAGSGATVVVEVEVSVGL